MEDSAPLVYLIYGIPNSGRRDIISDLIEGGIDDEKQVLYFKPEGEPESEADNKIESRSNVSTVPWVLAKAKVTHGQINAAPEAIFLLAPGHSDPADVAEALKTWSDHNGCEIARIITVVHCAFLEKTSKAQAWFSACIHYSDIVLLNRREGVNNKWIKEYEASFSKAHCPSRFALVKKGRVTNPADILLPEARRISLYFDELIPLEEDEFEDDEQPDDIKPDRFIERLESGHRASPIPNIQKFLDK